MTTEVKIQLTSAPAVSEADKSADASYFEWMKQWYPLAVTEFLDPTRPHLFIATVR